MSSAKIEGSVLLKRKAYWVNRFASIENGVFSYKKNKGTIVSLILFRRSQMEATVGPCRLQAQKGSAPERTQLHPNRVEVLLREHLDFGRREDSLPAVDQRAGGLDKGSRLGGTQPSAEQSGPTR